MCFFCELWIPMVWLKPTFFLNSSAVQVVFSCLIRWMTYNHEVYYINNVNIKDKSWSQMINNQHKPIIKRCSRIFAMKKFPSSKNLSLLVEPFLSGTRSTASWKELSGVPGWKDDTNELSHLVASVGGREKKEWGGWPVMIFQDHFEATKNALWKKLVEKFDHHIRHSRGCSSPPIPYCCGCFCSCPYHHARYHQ